MLRAALGLALLLAIVANAQTLEVIQLKYRTADELVDRPQRRLLVSVRFDDALDASRRDLAVGGSVGNRGVRIEASARDSQRNLAERVDQRVQTVDGGRATILTGQSRPVRQRQYIQTPAGVVSQEVTVVQETASGFEVVPRLAGESVSMDIISASTVQTVRGPVGEWFELGAIGARRVWAKVELLDK